MAWIAKPLQVCTASLLVAISLPAAAQVLWDNGGFVTHPGAGNGGADVSLNSPGEEDVAGDNVRLLVEPDPWFRIADDFSLANTVILRSITTYGYEPLVAAPQWSSANLRLWRGPPWEPASQVVFSANQSPIDLTFTGVYRVFNTEQLTSTERPIFRIMWDFSAIDVTPDTGLIVLSAGEYWIDWQVIGGESGWANPVMELGPIPSEPITVIDNGGHLRPAGWTPTGGVGREIPFIVEGAIEGVFSDSFEL